MWNETEIIKAMGVTIKISKFYWLSLLWKEITDAFPFLFVHRNRLTIKDIIKMRDSMRLR